MESLRRPVEPYILPLDRRREDRLSASAHRQASRHRLRIPDAMTYATQRTNVPVTVDDEKCIAEKGCTVCVDVCPLDVLAIDMLKGRLS
jgi:ferredoxin